MPTQDEQSEEMQRHEQPERFCQATKSTKPVSVNPEARTIEVIFTTGDLCFHTIQYQGVSRWAPTRLKVSKSSLQLDKLQGCPVLDAHYSFSAASVIGTVEKAWIDQGVGKARLRFANTAPAEEIWNLVQEGCVRECSLGFKINEMKLQSEKLENGSEREIFLITEIEPLEISMVPVGADRGAKVQSHQSITNNTKTKEKSIMSTQADPITDAPKAEVEKPSSSYTGGQTLTAASSAEDMRLALQKERENERERIAEITTVGQHLKTPQNKVNQAISDGMSVDEFRKQAIEDFAAQGQKEIGNISAQNSPITITEDAHDRFCQGATLALLQRGGIPGGEKNEFTGMTLTDLARQSLEVSGRSSKGPRMEMIGAAFTQAGAHGTSDFGHILSNVAGKAALRGWEESLETFSKWTRPGVLTDFKKTPRVGLGLIQSLPEVVEGANYTYGTVADRGEDIVLATYGRILNITRQAIINDDLSLLTQTPRKLGMAAKRTIGALVYGVLTGNPKLSDGKHLFVQDHRNIANPASALDVASLSKARNQMRTQRENPADETSPALNIVPSYLIVPAALETTATQLMTSKFELGENRGHAPNPVVGMAEVIVDPRLDSDSTTAWYLAADGNVFDTVEVAYLDGNSAPHIEQTESWKTDGTELKVRIDAGVAPLDYRTLYRNKGA